MSPAQLMFLFFSALIAVLLNVPLPGTASPMTQDTVAALGSALLDPNQYLLRFEVASVLLLAASISAVFVARGKKS